MTVNLAGSDLQYTVHYNVGMMQYRYLEQVHVFVLANILRRPIIIVGDPFLSGISGETLEPNDFVGIYLPIFHSPPSCHRSPVVLGFIVDHFVPLLGRLRLIMDPDSKTIDAIPLVSSTLEPLRIHFLLDDEQGAMANHLLQQYMLTCEVEMHDESDNSTSMVLCASLMYFAGYNRDDMLMPVAGSAGSEKKTTCACIYCSIALLLVQSPQKMPSLISTISAMHNYNAVWTFRILLSLLPSRYKVMFLRCLDELGDKRFTSEIVLGRSQNRGNGHILTIEFLCLGLGSQL